MTGPSVGLLAAAARPIRLRDDADHRVPGREQRVERRDGELRRAEEHDPQRRSGVYHLPARVSFRILRDDEIALDAAQTIDEQRAVEMIHLVLKRPRQQAGAFDLDAARRGDRALDDRARRPHDGGVESRHAQAALFFELHALALDELGIDDDDRARRVAAEREIDDEDPQRDADLRRRQPDARRGIHRLDHVVDEAIDLGRDGRRPGRAGRATAESPYLRIGIGAS